MTSKKDKALDLVKKLYAMSQDTGSPAEAANALRMMNKHMEKWGLTLADLADSEFGEQLIMEVEEGGVPLHVMYLGSAAALMCDCRATVMQYEDTEYQQFRFQGYEQDVEIATETLRYLGGCLERAAAQRREALTTTQQREQYEKTYWPNFSREVYRRCAVIWQEQQMEKSEQVDSKELMVVKAKNLDSEFGETDDIDDSVQAQDHGDHFDALLDSMTDASKVSLSKQLDDGENNAYKSLPPAASSV